MPKFVFQLDPVLRQRKQFEQHKQRELAQVQLKMQTLQDELRDLNDEVQGVNMQMRRGHLTGRLDMPLLTAHRRFLLGAQQRALSLMQRLNLVQRQLDEAQEALARAARDRKAIDKLREKHHERWRQRLGRRELTEQDELSMQLSYWNLADSASANDEAGD
jgi:flagellar protein FliJ